MIQTHLVSLFTRLGHNIMAGTGSLLSTIELNAALPTFTASITGSIGKVFISLHVFGDQQGERKVKFQTYLQASSYLELEASEGDSFLPSMAISSPKD